MFKLELHCHSRDVSDCATCSAEDEIRIYREAGYSGIVTTNHINRYSFKGLEDAQWEDKVAYFMAGYEKLKAAAGDGFDVLLGCEINLSPLGRCLVNCRTAAGRTTFPMTIWSTASRKTGCFRQRTCGP